MHAALIGIAVLVVDDDPDNLGVIEHGITEYGGSVPNWPGRSGSLESFQRAARLLLLDVGLPEVDRYALLAAIRRDGTLREIPDVAVTGHAYARDKRRGTAAGLARHLTGRWSPDELIAYLTELVSCGPWSYRTTAVRSAATPCAARRDVDGGARHAMLAPTGSHIDALKLVSSMTLFAQLARDVAGRPDLGALARHAEAILAAAAAQGYARCSFTEKALARRVSLRPES